MRFISLHVDGYGILHNLTIDANDLRGAPVVIYGLNEAGKSTLMSFIRGILFGFKAEGDKPEPVHGGQVGGWLLIEDGPEVFRVQRTGKGDGRVVVELPDGRKEGETFLRTRILRGVSPVLFRNVFAIGIEELRRLDDLKKEEVSSYIYGAGTGIKPEKIARAIHILNSSTLQLFNPRGRTQELNKILVHLDRLHRQIKQLEQQPAHYLQLKAEQAQLEKREEFLREERRKLLSRVNRLENLLKARDSWVKLQNLTTQLKEEELIESFPEDGLSRLKTLEERRANRLDVVSRYELAIKKLQEKLELLAIDSAVLAQGAVIKSLEAERALYMEKLQKLVEEETRIRSLEEQVEEQLADLGPGWGMESVLALDLSLAVRRQVQDYERTMRQQEESLGNALHVQESRQKEVRDKEEILGEINNRLYTLPVYKESTLSLPERFTLLEQLVRDVQEQTNLQMNIHQQQEKYNDLRLRKDFAEKGFQQAADFKKPLWIPLVAALLGLVGLFVAGPGLAGFFMLAVGIGLGVLIYSFLHKISIDSAARQRQFQQEIQDLEKEMERVQGSISRLGEDLKIVARRVQEAAAGLGLENGFTLDRLSQLRQELEKEQRDQSLREELNDQKEKAEKALKEALISLKDAEKIVDEERARRAYLVEKWHGWCRTRGFPGLTPVDMVSFISLADKVKENIKKLYASRNECIQIKKYVDEYVHRINSLAKILSREPATRETAPDYAVRLKELLEEQQARASSREQIQRELEKNFTEKQVAAAGVQEVEKALRELLNAARAKEAEEFRVLASRFAKQEKLKQEIAALEEQLLLLAGSPDELEAMSRELAGSTKGENEEDLKQLKEQLDRIEEEINQLKDELAEKKLRIEQMEGGEELARARQEKSMLEEKLLTRAREWRVRTLCASLLSLAREKHERERQPGVLLQASSYLGPMTDGRYIRVVAPFSAPDQLEVEQPDGWRVGVPFLSRGAGNQLYLALRLALAKHYGSLAAPMPIILDDILVDFDPHRLVGAVKVLGEIAAEQQVLFFTCHRHILEVIDRMLPGYKCVVLSSKNRCGR